MALEITNNVPEVVRNLKNGQRLLPDHLQSAFMSVGLYLLQEAKIDFQAKSRLQTAQDGTRWGDVQPETLAARQLRLSSSKLSRNWAQRQQLTTDRKLIEESGHRGEKKRLATISKRYQALLQKRAELLAAEVARHQVGVDTGRMRHALLAGTTGSSANVTPKLVKGGNLKAIGPYLITIGVAGAVDYAAHFDKARPIFGAGFMTRARQERSLKIWKEEVEAAMKKDLKSD